MQEWVDYMSKGYINSVGPELKIFKLDKTATELDELYGEAKTGRIYLPPFGLRGIYNNNKWVGFTDSGQYQEKEESMQLMFNFGDMVRKITDLKRKHTAEMFITYSGKGIPSIEKINNILTLYINNKSYLTFDLSSQSFSTVRKLGSRIDAYTDWTCRLAGQNDVSSNLIDFNKTVFSSRETMIYSIDDTYKNITDVVEVGDVIITDHNRLYEVSQSKPAGDFGWNYTLWQLDLTLVPIDRFNLPGNYSKQIKDSPHGLSKINME